MLCEKKVGNSGMGMKRFWGSVVLNIQKAHGCVTWGCGLAVNTVVLG